MKTKTQFLFVSILASTLLFVVGCQGGMFGKNPTPPNKFEQSVAQIATNTTLEQVIDKVTTTNQDGTVTSASFTNLVSREHYTMVPSTTTKETITSFSTVLDAYAPGVGTLLGAILTGSLATWLRLRSQKNAAPVLAQNIETMLEFIKTLPNGQKTHDTITQFLYDHQRETGTVNAVLAIINKYVSNPDAKDVASEIQGALTVLQSELNPAPS